MALTYEQFEQAKIIEQQKKAVRDAANALRLVMGQSAANDDQVMANDDIYHSPMPLERPGLFESRTGAQKQAADNLATARGALQSSMRERFPDSQKHRVPYVRDETPYLKYARNAFVASVGLAALSGIPFVGPFFALGAVACGLGAIGLAVVAKPASMIMNFLKPSSPGKPDYSMASYGVTKADYDAAIAQQARVDADADADAARNSAALHRPGVGARRQFDVRPNGLMDEEEHRAGAGARAGRGFGDTQVADGARIAHLEEQNRILRDQLIVASMPELSSRGRTQRGTSQDRGSNDPVSRRQPPQSALSVSGNSVDIRVRMGEIRGELERVNTEMKRYAPGDTASTDLHAQREQLIRQLHAASEDYERALQQEAAPMARTRSQSFDGVRWSGTIQGSVKGRSMEEIRVEEALIDEDDVLDDDGDEISEVDALEIRQELLHGRHDGLKASDRVEEVDEVPSPPPLTRKAQQDRRPHQKTSLGSNDDSTVEQEVRSIADRKQRQGPQQSRSSSFSDASTSHSDRIVTDSPWDGVADRKGSMDQPSSSVAVRKREGSAKRILTQGVQQHAELGATKEAKGLPNSGKGNSKKTQKSSQKSSSSGPGMRT